MTFERGRYLFHNYLHIIALCGIGVGLTLNRVVLSVSIMVSLLNLLTYGKFGMYRDNLKHTRFAIGAWLYIALMLLSFLWSSDWAMAFKEAKPKIVLLVVPLVFLAGPLLSKRSINAIRVSFLASLVLTSLLNVLFYVHWIGNRTYTDFREISLFGSHIRFSLLIVMGIIIVLFRAYEQKSWRLYALPLVAWFAGYLWFSQSLSGYIIAGCVCMATLLWAIFRMKKTVWRLAFVSAFILLAFVFVAGVVYVLSPDPHKVSYAGLPKVNANGRLVYTDPTSDVWVNGYPVYAMIEPTELEREWNKRSEIDYSTGLNKKGNQVSATIISYLASRNLPKDSLGIARLSNEEIGYIESGIASVSYLGKGVVPRLATLRDHLNGNTDPNGNTLLQRVEYWKASRGIIGENWLIGVGFGDLRKAFSDYYNVHHSVLKEEYRNISHNEYLFSWVAMGVSGIAIFIYWWLAYFLETFRRRQLEAYLFGVVFVCSCLFEDTLGTQMGASLTAFFFGFYCYLLKHREASINPA